MKKKVKLIALDLDGTLLNSKGNMTDVSMQAIKKATDKGIVVTASTGRNFDAILPEQLAEAGVTYAITTNGSAVYDIATRTLLQEKGLSAQEILPLLQAYETDPLYEEIYMELYVDGSAYCTKKSRTVLQQMDLPVYLKEIMQAKCNIVENMQQELMQQEKVIQKGALLFGTEADRERKHWNLIRRQLEEKFLIQVVDGGCNNQEFSKAGVTKGTGLTWLAKYLHIPLSQTMAIGDSENDWSILDIAGVSVAMENASKETKDHAAYVTKSNEADGVAWAIDRILSEDTES